MEAAWLRSQLESGRSIESIAREVGRAPSTVAYWASKHGLVSQHAARHAARGGLSREALAPLVERGLSTRAIATELGVSQATVRHWLAKHVLSTRRSRHGDSLPAADDMRTCPVHGLTKYVRYGPRDHLRCLSCRKERVVARRRTVKALLVAEAGGCCRICGYARYSGALQFHHVDPATKQFNLGLRGIARSLERCREEMRKCVLLCANCHAEVEGGVAELP